MNAGLVRTISDNKPIFIIGSPRSGTSILTWCIGQHSNILPLPETHWIAEAAMGMKKLYAAGTLQGKYTHLGALDWSETDFYAAYGEAIDRLVFQTRKPRLNFILNQKLGSTGVTADRIEERKKIIEQSTTNFAIERSVDDPKKRWVDGTPRNTSYVYGLALMFPEARFIHLLRDPSDVVLSLSNFSQAGKGGNNHNYNEANKVWRQHVSMAALAEEAFGPAKTFRILYSELNNSGEKTLRKLFDFLEEEFESDCLLPLSEKINSSHGKINVNKPANMVSEVNRLFYNDLLDQTSSLESGKEDAMVQLEQHHYRLLIGEKKANWIARMKKKLFALA